MHLLGFYNSFKILKLWINYPIALRILSGLCIIKNKKAHYKVKINKLIYITILQFLIQRMNDKVH